MASKAARSEDNRVYSDFEPSTAWAPEAAYDTLIVHLPDFKKEQLKVQVTSSRKLRISGERLIGDNKWSRFRKEFPIPSNYDTNEITAKFEGGALYVKHPKIITPAAAAAAAADQQPPLLIPKPPHQKPTTTTTTPSQSQKKAQEQVTDQQVPSKPVATEKQKVPNNDDSQKPTTQESQVIKSRQEEATQHVPPKIMGMNKQPNGVENANKVSQKEPEKEKEQIVTNKTSSVDDAKTVSQKGKGLIEEAKTTVATMLKDKNLGGASDGLANQNKKAGILNARDKFRHEDLKQALAGLAMELKQPRKLMNLVVAVFVLMAAIYARNAMIRFIGKSDDHE